MSVFIRFLWFLEFLRFCIKILYKLVNNRLEIKIIADLSHLKLIKKTEMKNLLARKVLLICQFTFSVISSKYVLILAHFFLYIIFYVANTVNCVIARV